MGLAHARASGDGTLLSQYVCEVNMVVLVRAQLWLFAVQYDKAMGGLPS